MNIQEIRQQYPQYNDLSDKQLVDALYDKSYSDMDRSAFNQKIGFSDRATAYQTSPQSLIPGSEQAIAPTPQEPTSLPEDVVGAGETALTLLSGMTGGMLGMAGGTIHGIGKEVLEGNFGTNEAADRVEQAAMKGMQSLTYAPRTPAGFNQVKTVGTLAQQLGPLAGLPGEAAIIASGVRPALTMASKPVGMLKQAPIDLLRKQTPKKQNIARLLEQGSTDVETAKFVLDKPRVPQPTKLQQTLGVVGPTVKKDQAAKAALKQGFDEGIIAAIKGSSPVDKLKMDQMVDIMVRGKKNARYAAQNRPSDVAGDTLFNSVKTIRTANKQAGWDIDRAATTLRGKPVDITEATVTFGNTLDELGVKLVPDGKGGFVPDFKLSQLAPGDRGPLKEVIRQMNIQGGKGLDAFAVHKMKRIIDNNVTYGKVKTGMGGDAERALKTLRHSLDEVLDTNFPAYNKANTKYSKTINALNSLKDVAGRTIDLSGGNADKALGTLLRRTLSNAQSRVRLIDSIAEIEAVAKKYGGSDLRRLVGAGQGSDDLLTQVLFVDELDAMFGPSARTSFQGQISQALKQGVDATTSKSGAVELGLKTVGKTADKLRGINQDGAIKAIRELLSQ